MTRTPVPESVVLWRRLSAEFLGSGLLAAVVIGSGIATERLSPGDTGLELLENAAATAAGLFAIIVMFGPVSGGHFNPVVSFADAFFGGLRWRDAAACLPAPVPGCVAGAVAANLMFARAAVSISAKYRMSGAHNGRTYASGRGPSPKPRPATPAGYWSPPSARRESRLPGSPTWCWSWPASAPTTELAKSAGVRVGARGAITVDRMMRTGLPGIYAAGDCVITHHRLLGETYLPLGTTAHKQGRVAGENTVGGNRQFAGASAPRS